MASYSPGFPTLSLGVFLTPLSWLLSWLIPSSTHWCAPVLGAGSHPLLSLLPPQVTSASSKLLTLFMSKQFPNLFLLVSPLSQNSRSIYLIAWLLYMGRHLKLSTTQIEPLIKQNSWEFPGNPAVSTLVLSLLWAWVQSLDGEPRSRNLCSVEKKKKNRGKHI